MEELRRYERFEVPLEIRVAWPGVETIIGITRDFSDGGAFIYVVFPAEPPAGTFMQLQLNSQVNGKDAPIIEAKVVRVTAEGIAFQFTAVPAD